MLCVSIVYPKQALVGSGKKKDQEASTISFTISCPSYSNALESVRIQAQLAMAGASRIEKQVKVEEMVGYSSEADKSVEPTTKAVDFVKLLLEKVGIVIDIGDQIAEVIKSQLMVTHFLCGTNQSSMSQIHPYATMAWSVLSPALKVCIHTYGSFTLAYISFSNCRLLRNKRKEMK
jgi:hypothetical protein